MNFKIVIFKFCEELHWNLDGDGSQCVDCFWWDGLPNHNIKPTDHEHGWSFHLLGSSSISFFRVLKFLLYSPFALLVRFVSSQHDIGYRLVFIPSLHWDTFLVFPVSLGLSSWRAVGFCHRPFLHLLRWSCGFCLWVHLCSGLHLLISVGSAIPASLRWSALGFQKTAFS